MSTSTSTPFRPNASALITGGASGIGYAVAQLCLSHGMKVTIADFNQETIDMAAKNLGNVSCVKMDVGEREEWKRVKDKVGDVDFLMLNAGVGGKGTWGDEEYFDRVRGPVGELHLVCSQGVDPAHEPQRRDQWVECVCAGVPER